MRLLSLVIVFSCFAVIANQESSKPSSWAGMYQRAAGGLASAKDKAVSGTSALLAGVKKGAVDYAGQAYASCPRYSQLSKALSNEAKCQSDPYHIVKLIGIIEGCGYYRTEKRPALSCLRAYRNSKSKPAFLERATNKQAEQFMQATLRWLLDAKEGQNMLSENKTFIEVPLSRKYLMDVLDGVYFKMTFDEDLSEIMQEEIKKYKDRRLSYRQAVEKAIKSQKLIRVPEKMLRFVRKVYLHKESSGPIIIKVPIQKAGSLFIDLYGAFEPTGKSIQDNDLAKRVYENWWVHFFMDDFGVKLKK